MKNITHIILISFFIINLPSCKEKIKTSETTEVNNKTINNDSILSESDTLIFHWEADMCAKRGWFLSSEFSERELQNTYSLWRKLESGLTTSVSAFYPQNIEEIDIAALTKEYNQLIHFIDTCKIVDVPFWKDFASSQKQSLKKQYDLNKMQGEAYTNPSVLLGNKYIDKDSECNKYAKALNAEDTQVLYDEWEAWINKSKKNNGDPEAYVQRFRDKYNSPNKLTYARIDLITFAWWNCVNGYIDYPDYAILSEEFNRLFFRVEEYDCEEP